MEAVTIHSDDHDNKAQVIHTYAPSGLVSSLILAQVSRDDATITYVDITGHANRSINLPEEAMAALMTLWGGTAQRSETGDLGMLRDAYGDKCEAYEAESHARMAAVNDLGSAKAEIERLRRQLGVRASGVKYYINAMCEVEKERDALKAQIAAMQSQESFRVALLESVVSAARDVLGQERDSEDWLGLEDALQGLDEWQPDDASTDVSVAVVMVDTCMFCGTKRGDPHKETCEAYAAESLPF